MNINLQELINDLFKDCNIEINLTKTDIIEYMILEDVNGLDYIQGKNYNPGYKLFEGEGYRFSQGDETSDSQNRVYGVWFQVTKQEERFQLQCLKKKFIQKFGDDIVPDKYPDEEPDLTLAEDPGTIGFKLQPEWVESAIHNSSLVQAAGDLTNLDLKELIQLRQALSQFSMKDQTVNSLVAYLQNKIDSLIAQLPVHSEENLQQVLQQVKNQTESNRFYFNKEMQFNLILNELEDCLKPLIKKGTSEEEQCVGVAESYPAQYFFQMIKNSDFDEDYIPAREAAEQLINDLQKALDGFFSQPKQNDFPRFRAACYQAIEHAESELAKFPGFEKTKALITVLEVVVETTGDLSLLDVPELLKLMEKSSTFRKNHKAIIKIIDANVLHIKQAMTKHPEYNNYKEQSESLSQSIQKSREERKIYSKKKSEFKEIFKQLDDLLKPLIQKGSRSNKSFNPKYVPAKNAAERLQKALQEALQEASETFFDCPDAKSLEEFKRSCLNAIQLATPILVKNYGYWQTNPIVILFISILDKLLDLHAFFLKKEPTQHYRDTFFADTQVTEQLKSFKENLTTKMEQLSGDSQPNQP